jgi:hypothetical protein
MKSQHAVSTNKTLTFCGAKNILGEKKLNHRKYPKTQLTLYTKTYKDYVKTESSKFASGHFMDPFRN